MSFFFLAYFVYMYIYIYNIVFLYNFVFGLFCVINFLAVINQSLITLSEWLAYCIIFMFFSIHRVRL